MLSLFHFSLGYAVTDWPAQIVSHRRRWRKRATAAGRHPNNLHLELFLALDVPHVAAAAGDDVAALVAARRTVVFGVVEPLVE